MRLLYEISSIFTIKNNLNKLVEDKFSTFNIEYVVDKINDLSIDSISNLTAKIPATDSYILTIKVGDNDPICFDSNNKQFANFVNGIQSELTYLENEQISLTLNCSKNLVNGARHIYDFESFNEFWSNSSITSILNLLHKDLENSNFIFFKYLEDNLESFYTSNLFWGYTKPEINSPDYKCHHSKDNCHFGNYESYPFNPNCFKIISNPAINNHISSKLIQLQTIFCITNIFDITSFLSNHSLYYKINGYKTFEGSISFTELSTTPSSKTYIELYNWVYSTDGNINDKIGLTRNILTIYLKEGSIDIPSETFSSIQSGYKTYLQENVSKYIELRNKINDELSWISQKSSDIVEKHLSNYLKSIFTFMSFFISVFVLKIMQTGEFKDVFTKAPTILCLSFLFISIIFLVFSLTNLSKEKERITRKYENIKNRYTDLLLKDDINKILRNDKEFNYEMEFIDNRRKSYTWLWIITLIVLATAIFSLSSYINFQLIFNFIYSKIN